MASATEESLPRANDVLKPINDDTDMSVEKVHGSSHPPLERAPSRPSPTDPALVDANITYPEGGLQAWLVVLGAFCGLTASLGIYNSTGVFEAYISREILSEEPPSTVGWIFGIYSFMTFFGGVQVGPTFDAKGPRGLLIAGSVCTLVGIFVLSICTDYYQFILAFSILAGGGSSLLLTPAMGSVAHWFYERRGLASGIAFTGGGFGGVVFPLMMQSLLPQIGWAWSVRVLGFIVLVLCIISVVFCRSRVPPRNGPRTTWRDTLPDMRIFMDGTGAMSLTTAGIFLTDLAYLVPMTYVPSYYLERQDLPQDRTLTGDAAFAYQLLAIINSASCVGRFIAGDLGDRFGRYNTMIVSLTLCLISVGCFFLPDSLVPETPSIALLIIFTILFGFVSGSNVSLTPVCLGQLCETQEYGRYYATCYTMVSFGCLISIPIAGSLLDATGSTGRQRYWGAIAYTGASYLGALLCFIWVRVRVKGSSWRTKW
ncbi:major facilitator superfamily domain-containing protein [Hypoxylon sp. FL1150]|nr:major facilitator superfamily domain-containing protein [Hypoxylon sp. FL1150]